MDKKNPNKNTPDFSDIQNQPQDFNDAKAVPVARQPERHFEDGYLNEKKRRGVGISCNTLGCLFFLLIAICCIGTILTIVNRPPVVWDRVVDYLNSGLVLTPYEPSNITFVQENILSNIKNGQNDIYITEDELTTIARDKLTQFNDLRFDLEPEKLTMTWALDSGEKPVYAQVQMAIKDGVVKITKVGAPNLPLPEFTNETLNKLILSILNLNSSDSSDANLLSTLIASDSNLKINKIEFQKDKLYLDVFVNVSLF